MRSVCDFAVTEPRSAEGAAVERDGADITVLPAQPFGLDDDAGAAFRRQYGAFELRTDEVIEILPRIGKETHRGEDVPRPHRAAVLVAGIAALQRELGVPDLRNVL